MARQVLFLSSELDSSSSSIVAGDSWVLGRAPTESSAKRSSLSSERPPKGSSFVRRAATSVDVRCKSTGARRSGINN